MRGHGPVSQIVERGPTLNEGAKSKQEVMSLIILFPLCSNLIPYSPQEEVRICVLPLRLSRIRTDKYPSFRRREAS